MIIELHGDPHTVKWILPRVQEWLIKNLKGPRKIKITYERNKMKMEFIGAMGQSVFLYGGKITNGYQFSPKLFETHAEPIEIANQACQKINDLSDPEGIEMLRQARSRYQGIKLYESAQSTITIGCRYQAWKRHLEEFNRNLLGERYGN